MAENVVMDKSFDFAARVVLLCRYLQEEKREYVLTKQLMRSGTAIGALIREADQAESKPDFIHKMAIALKEANETAYWIELLRKCDLIDENGFKSIHLDVVEMIKLLTSIINTAKRRPKDRTPSDR